MGKTSLLIFGAGWLGKKYAEYFHAPCSSVRIHEYSAVCAELDRATPSIVINAAGKTGKPNIDWCEEHKAETVESNITGPLVLVKACLDRNIRFVHLSSGCIFSGTKQDGSGFTEEDIPAPVSFYAWTKATADGILKRFPVLILRIRMPMDPIPDPRNLITKIAHYPRIVDVENSVTLVPDLLHATQSLLEQGATGIYHVTNPGTIRHRDLLAWYTEIVDPSHRYELISGEEFSTSGLVKTGRSHCILDTSKLAGKGIHLPDASQAIRDTLHAYKKARDQELYEQ